MRWGRAPSRTGSPRSRGPPAPRPQRRRRGERPQERQPRWGSAWGVLYQNDFPSEMPSRPELRARPGEDRSATTSTRPPVAQSPISPPAVPLSMACGPRPWLHVTSSRSHLAREGSEAGLRTLPLHNGYTALLRTASDAVSEEAVSHRGRCSIRPAAVRSASDETRTNEPDDPLPISLGGSAATDARTRCRTA